MTSEVVSAAFKLLFSCMPLVWNLEIELQNNFPFSCLTPGGRKKIEQGQRTTSL